jgi:hypothetical protein
MATKMSHNLLWKIANKILDHGNHTVARLVSTNFLSILTQGCLSIAQNAEEIFRITIVVSCTHLKQNNYQISIISFTGK